MGAEVTGPNDFELMTAEEIRDKVCPECGSDLLRVRRKAWCEWCGRYVRAVPPPKHEVIGSWDSVHRD